MPKSGRTLTAGARLLAIAAVVLAVVAVALLMFGSVGGGHVVRLTLDNAGQLVVGNEVKVGGVPVGEVDTIELTPDGRAEIELDISDRELLPLHTGTVAILRSTSLSGIANRYIALTPGPNSAPEIPDGGEIPAEDGRVAVDLDQILNTLGPATRADLRALVRRSADVFEGVEVEANDGLRALNPALSQSAITARELVRDRSELERFVVETADVASALASRPEDLEQATGNALGGLSAIARESRALDRSLDALPGTLRQANTTLVNLRATLGDVRPAVREARPVAPPLSRVLELLRPVVRDARPVVGDLRRTIDRPGRSDDLLGVLRGLPSLERTGVPALRSAVATVGDALPMVRDVRPYVPDLVGGQLNGFGGTTGGYYDANGRYVRISFQANFFSLTNTGSLIPVPPAQQGVSGYRMGVDKRCPGAGTQTAPDRSNPYLDRPGFPCDLDDSPR